MKDQEIIKTVFIKKQELKGCYENIIGNHFEKRNVIDVVSEIVDGILEIYVKFEDDEFGFEQKMLLNVFESSFKKCV